MNIPHSSPWITPKDIEFVTQRLQSGLLSQGDMVTQFEKGCGTYLGQKYLTATSNGRSALTLALKALNIRKGDEVILPSYCCHAVEDAVTAVGATPILCDIGKNWCMTAQTISTVTTLKTKAIIAVHTFGIACDMKAICDLDIPVIEDCCQYFCEDAGKFGQISIFSFHATKCLTTGEGGMIASQQPLNINNSTSVMSDLQASLGIAQLNRYSEILKKRKSIADRYNTEINLPCTKLAQSLNDSSLYFRYPLMVDNGYDAVAPKFEKNGISVRRGVDALLHRKQNLPDDLFPNTVEKFNKTVSIPLYPALNTSDVQKVIDTTRWILS